MSDLDDLQRRVDAMAKLAYGMKRQRRSRGYSAPEGFMFRCGCEDCRSRRGKPFATRVDKAGPPERR